MEENKQWLADDESLTANWRVSTGMALQNKNALPKLNIKCCKDIRNEENDSDLCRRSSARPIQAINDNNNNNVSGNAWKKFRTFSTELLLIESITLRGVQREKSNSSGALDGSAHLSLLLPTARPSERIRLNLKRKSQKPRSENKQMGKGYEMKRASIMCTACAMERKGDLPVRM